ALPPRSKWCARGSWRCTSRGRLRRSTCASVNRLRTGWPRRAAWRRRLRTARDRGGPAMPKLKVVMPDDEPDNAVEPRAEELRLLEAMLFASAEPLDETSLAERLPQGVDVHAALLRLQEEYAARGVHLVRIGGKWTFRTASDLSWLLSKETIETRKLSRAAIETLAIIAYHQPVTRAEIEEIRGVTTSKGSVDVLLETGWIRPRGRRKSPGRPVTYGTSEAFLSHFGLDAVGDLPGLEELKGSGLLDGRLPPGFSVPMPSDDPALHDDEDPLEPGDLDLGLAPPPERTGEDGGALVDACGMPRCGARAGTRSIELTRGETPLNAAIPTPQGRDCSRAPAHARGRSPCFCRARSLASGQSRETRQACGPRRCGGFAHGFNEHLALDSGSGRRPSAVRRARQDLGADGRFRQWHQVVQERAHGRRNGQDRPRQDGPEADGPPAGARSAGDRNGDAQGRLSARAPRRRAGGRIDRRGAGASRASRS